MKYIDERKINDLLNCVPKTTDSDLENVLNKAKSLKRLSLEETALLLNVIDSCGVNKILDAAAVVKNAVYGNRVVLFVPLYISNVCMNHCGYCAFSADNQSLKRKTLTMDEIKEQTQLLLRRGHKRILMVAGEGASFDGKTTIEYYTEAMRAVYSVNVGTHKIKRVNMNCAPLSVSEFKMLKAAGVGTYQIFQETYHENSYQKLHPFGPKSDPDRRLDAVDHAFLAGIDDVGIGVLYGLYDYRFDTLAMLMHVEELEKKFNVGPHTISVPRLEPALNSDFSVNSSYKVSDDEFKKLVAILRLSVPYAGIILSTRESPQMRNALFNLGVSQVSAESSASPGGYSSFEVKTDHDAQFTLGDHRSLEEVIHALLEKNVVPSFCAACYRRERTGETFMKLAKPGIIKEKCRINALVTLKEYLDDFGSEKTKQSGYKVVMENKILLNKESQDHLTELFDHIDSGIRDEYV